MHALYGNGKPTVPRQTSSIWATAGTTRQGMAKDLITNQVILNLILMRLARRVILRHCSAEMK